MGFNIPMVSKGALDLSSIRQGGLTPQQNNNYNNTPNNYNNNFNNNFQQNTGVNNTQNNYSQQQNFNQNQMNNYSQQTNNYSQPQTQMQQQPQQNYNQPNYNQAQPVQQAQPSYNQPVQQPNSGKQGVHLKKGQKFAITGNGNQLTTIKLGLGWDVTNQACDLDASAFMLGADGRVIGDEWFVFYGQPTSPDGSIRHSGDSSGEGTGDDEVITVNLNQVNNNVQRVAFIVTIDEALSRGLNFSMVRNAYVRVLNADNNAELARFDLTDYYSNVTSMVVGELYRHNGEWKFNPVGDGTASDLAGLCARYGVNVAD